MHYTLSTKAEKYPTLKCYQLHAQPYGTTGYAAGIHRNGELIIHPASEGANISKTQVWKSVEEILAREEKDGIIEIAKSVENLGEIAQQNSNSSVELAATSERLFSYSITLDREMSSYKL